MFKVKHKNSDIVYVVYSVQACNDGTKFFIYDKFYGWYWADSYSFVPVCD